MAPAWMAERQMRLQQGRQQVEQVGHSCMAGRRNQLFLPVVCVGPRAINRASGSLAVGRALDCGFRRDAVPAARNTVWLVVVCWFWQLQRLQHMMCGRLPKRVAKHSHSHKVCVGAAAIKLDHGSGFHGTACRRNRYYAVWVLHVSSEPPCWAGWQLSGFQQRQQM